MSDHYEGVVANESMVGGGLQPDQRFKSPKVISWASALTERDTFLKYAWNILNPEPEPAPSDDPKTPD